jgi:hypothetical protein
MRVSHQISQSGEGMSVPATISSVARIGNAGEEKWEIRFSRNEEANLPVHIGKRVLITLQVGRDTIFAKLHATEKNRYFWISQSIVTATSERGQLATFLKAAGYSRNERIFVSIQDRTARVLKSAIQ